jgi:hypothetical protein
LYNTIDAVSQRVEGVLSFWEQLDAMRYFHPITTRGKRGTLADLIAFHFRWHMAMWVDAPTGDIRQALCTTIDQMRRASEDEIHSRLIRQLRYVANENTYLQHREWLLSPGVIETALTFHAEKGWRPQNDPRAGYYGSLSSFLSQLEREHHGA